MMWVTLATGLAMVALGAYSRVFPLIWMGLGWAAFGWVFYRVKRWALWDRFYGTDGGQRR